MRTYLKLLHSLCLFFVPSILLGEVERTLYASCSFREVLVCNLCDLSLEILSSTHMYYYYDQKQTRQLLGESCDLKYFSTSSNSHFTLEWMNSSFQIILHRPYFGGIHLNLSFALSFARDNFCLFFLSFNQQRL